MQCHRSTINTAATAIVGLFALACDSNIPSSPAAAATAAATSASSVAPAATILQISFDTYPLGPLGAPWGGTRAGSSRLTVVSTANHGNALRDNAGSSANDWLSYTTSFPSTSNSITVEFDIIPAAGASPSFHLKGSGYGSSNNTFRLQRDPGSPAFNSSAGNCGNVVDGQWNHVIVTMNSAFPRTFTVKINGASTAACTNAPTSFTPPYKGIGIFDPINAGYGGLTGWDNFWVY